MSDNAERASALAPWVRADLPEPPRPRGFSWISVCGPGIIVLGVSIGSGEFLLGPATFVKHGFSLLWVTLAAVFFQTVFNTELMRYTLATGEPVVTGFMRTRPGKTFWAWFYAFLYFLQIGWPAWAATAAGAIFFLAVGRLAHIPAESMTIYAIGVATLLSCVFVLLLGRRIARTLEILNWILVICIIGGFAALAIAYAAPATWAAAVVGFVGYDLPRGGFNFLPDDVDILLLGALVGYSGGGGVLNLARWRGWWRIVRVDQWGIFFIGALLGMMLPSLLYVTFIESGTNIMGPSISAVLANNMSLAAAPWLGLTIAALGVWILFKTQLDVIEGMTRSITDILWTGSVRVRDWRGGDVRAVYYTVLSVIAIWGIVASMFVAPDLLLKIGANIAGIVFIVASIHVLYVNTRLLPPALRPPLWRRCTLLAMVAFYGFFLVLVTKSFL